MAMKTEYPRLRDLPETERVPFNKWLYGQTRPVTDPTLPHSEWDEYYPWDYDRWKAGLPCID